MRLAGKIKMGYYPTPPEVTRLALPFLRRDGAGRISLLDPCAGEGTAAAAVAARLDAEAYGVELDRERAAAARKALHRILQSDFFATRISHRAFSLLWLNPPYDWDSADESGLSAKRLEQTFLQASIPYLSGQGILAYLIPEHRMDHRIARILAAHFSGIATYRFPDPIFNTFRQVIVFGVKKPISTLRGEEETIARLIRHGNGTEPPPFLAEDPPAHVYTVPTVPAPPALFQTTQMTPAALAEEADQHGLYSRLDDLLNPPSLIKAIKPIMPLRKGHLALLLASGLVNGVVAKNGERYLIKGACRKETTVIDEYDADREESVTREIDRFVISVTAFNLATGAYEVIQ